MFTARHSHLCASISSTDPRVADIAAVRSEMPFLTLITAPASLMRRPLGAHPTAQCRTRLAAANLCSLSTGAPHPDQLKITSFWRSRLADLTKPAAVSLVPHLSTANELCFENMAKASSKTSGTLVEFANLEKQKRPDHLLLIRVGEFYEAFGLDALMLVQHAGLNPMGRKCRAGMPIANLQAALDDLTAAGLTVAVYEEIAPPGGDGPFRKLKPRALTQVVSAASPVYRYEACLSHNEITYAEPPPYAGVTASASGYSIVFVDVDSRTTRVHERLSYPALEALLSARPYAPPLLVNDLAGLSPLPRALADREKRALNVKSPGLFPRAVLDYVAEETQVDARSFRALPRRGEGHDTPPAPLYYSTATQIGLLPTPGIPDLVRALLPSGSPSACSHLLRRWLLLPPRPSVGDAMHAACRELIDARVALPTARPVPVGKLVSLVLARQANAPLLLDARQLLVAMHAALGASELAALNEALLALVAEEAGLRLGPRHLRATAATAADLIASTVADATAAAADEPTTDAVHGLIPHNFFRRNEGFRALLRRDVAAAEYDALERAAAELCDAVAADVMASGKVVVHDTINNAIYLRKGKSVGSAKAAAAAAASKEALSSEVALEAKPGLEVGAEGDVEDAEEAEAASADGESEARLSLEPAGDRNLALEIATSLEPARDRNRRLLANRFVSSRVRERTVAYLAACDDAERAVKGRLQALCDDLQPLMPTLVTAAHWVLLASTLTAHVGHAMQQQWALPALRAETDPDRSLTLEGVWPYWLPAASATANDVRFDGLWLLTAPNMAGKSSLMRSMLVAGLLANCGLLAPVRAASVPRYDTFFLRTTSVDAPAEGKSAFAPEMDDLRVLTAEGSARSLVMLDEIGRGTSTAEGAALSAALLEWLDEQSIGAVFATHLHEVEGVLERLPAPLPSLHRYCLPVATDDDGTLRMTFTITEGVMRSSLALHVARRAGLPNSLLERAQELLLLPDAAQDGAHDQDGAGDQDGAQSVAARSSSDGADRTACDVSFAPAGRTVAGAADGDGGDGGDDGAARQLRVASEVLRTLSGRSEILRVGDGWEPPPRLSGRSCVYLLQLSGRQPPSAVSALASAALDDERWRAPTKGTGSGRATLYVGESDSIGRRLQQHRRAHSKRRLECVLVEVESKTAARELEARTIRELKARNIGHVRNIANS